MWKWFLAVVAISGWAAGSASPVAAQVKGLIVGPGADRHRVAVSPLKNMGQEEDGRGLSQEIAKVIAKDLNQSGWFRVIDSAAYIEDPQATGIQLGGFDFADWSTIGAEALIKGGFATRGDRVSVEFRLFDVFQKKQLVGKKYMGDVKDVRRIAHRFVDEMILHFTGIRGIFDTRIAYVSTGGDRFKEIYVSHLDGSEKVKVTRNRTINLFPSWSPSGSEILYTSYKNGKPQVFSYDFSSGKESAVSSRTGLNLGGRWGPEGKSIAIALEKNGNIDIYLVSPSGEIVRRLTKHPGIDVSPTWSPDGKQLAFVSDRGGGPQIYTYDLDSGRIQRVTYEGNYNTSPDWSPGGDRIAFTGLAGNFDIYTIRPDGRERLQVTSHPADDEDPSWSPDGRFIAFASNRTGRHLIYIMQANGDDQTRLTGSAGDDTNPSWSPRLP